MFIFGILNCIMSGNKKIVNSGRFSEVVPEKKKGTRLEERAKDNKETLETLDRLKVTGQESDKKAIKWVQEEVKEDKKKDYNMEMTEVEWLYSKRRYADEDYLEALGSMLYHKLKAAELPFGYKTHVEVDGRNIAAFVTDRFGRKYAKGFRACGEVKYDHFAVNQMVIEAENTTDHLEGSDEARKTKGGLYLPPTIKI